MQSPLIPTNQYKTIVSALPILCVDLVITNENGEYLLVRRTNEPLKGCWWVVGGRVHKGETISEAGHRKAREELGIDIDITRSVGFFEAPRQQDPFDRPEHTYHGVSIVLAGKIHPACTIELDNQSNAWKFAPGLPPEFVIVPFDPACR